MGLKREKPKSFDAVRVADYLSYRDYLNALFTATRAVSGGRRYSHQKFAEDLGFSATNVIRLVIIGQRKLTQLTSERIANSLDLKGAERRYFAALVRYNNARRPETREQLFTDLIAIKNQILPTPALQEALEYYSEWYHPVIREMVGCENFNSDPVAISGRLFNGVLPKQVARSLDLLEKLDLIRFDAVAGRHRQSSGQVTPGRSVEVMAAVRYHQKMIEIAGESLTRIDETKREIHGVTVRISDRTAEKIKLMIKEACAEVMAMEQSGDDADQIYQFNVQLFPFTRT